MGQAWDRGSPTLAGIHAPTSTETRASHIKRVVIDFVVRDCQPAVMSTSLLPAPAFVQAHLSYGTSGAHHLTRSPVVTVPSIVHAAAVTSPPPSSPWFQDRNGKSSEWKALCGAVVRVLLPAIFDGDSRVACQSCSTEVEEIYETDRPVPFEERVFTLRPAGRVTTS